MYIEVNRLTSFVKEIFIKLDVPEEQANRAADVLIMADLRGIHSHGCTRLSSFYVPMLENGTINPSAKLQRLDLNAKQLFNANQGLGLALAPEAMESAIESAKNYKVGMAWVINSSHFGIASYYTLMATQSNIIGIALTNGSPAVAPGRSKQAFFGTNAFSVSCPGEEQNPLVIDMATSAISLGSLQDLAFAGKPVSADFVAEALRESSKTHSDVPLSPSIVQKERMLALWGGQNGWHKGLALSIIIELFAAILPGGHMSFQLSHGQACHFFVAIRPDLLEDTTSVKEALCLLSQTLNNAPMMPNSQKIHLPGSKANKTHIKHLTLGIPLPRKTITTMEKLGQRMGLRTLLSLQD